jgi:hypothetical protein
MSTDVLELQMDAVARHIRISSDHQRSMVQILRGSGTVAALVGDSTEPGPDMDLASLAPVVDPGAPALADETWVRVAGLASTPSSSFDPVEGFFAPTTQAPAGPFDGIISAVATPSTRRPPVGPLPPRSRFMMRVARVDRPHRATKRDYDYFEELNAALAALANKDAAERG